VASTRGLKVRCPAKINLGLWILGRRPDGYHEIDTVMQTVSLEDDLLLLPSSEFEFMAKGIPVGGEGPNIVERAWDLLAARAPLHAGVRVELTKRIPVAAGLGGGSSDAAGFVVGVNRLLSLELTGEEILDITAQLGSDVPFFLHGGTARATGRGVEVRHLCPAPPAWVVLATPPVTIATTWAYSRVKIPLTHRERGATILAAAIASQDWRFISPHFHNDFEDVVLPEFEVVAGLRRALDASGVLGSLLSGSGSTVFGLARTRDEAQAAARIAAERGATVHVVRTTERGVALAGLS
jgi:4-diphosphocytidyl-2-C-methyl-D-erythritol kinase